jgi:Fur family transcriptional regulator, peroxide stress response regulator
MNIELHKIRLRNKGIKVTPRRISLLEAIIELNNHPTAEEIIKFIRNGNLNIATATVYKALNILVAKKVIIKVETRKNIIRYDAILDSHHHLFSTESNLIKDYQNEEINMILKKYFKKNKIEDFEIEEIKLQIIGKFKNNKNNSSWKKTLKS